MAVIGGVRVYELAKGNSERLTRLRGPSAVKAYWVPSWHDRYTVANALMGLVSYTASGGTITLNSPGAYPESANMWAQEIAIKGVGTPTQGPRQIAWTSAIVEVSYAPGEYNTSQAQDPGGVNSFDPAAPLVYATQTLDYSDQVVTLPKGACKYVTGSPGSPTYTVLNQTFGLPVGVVSMELTLHYMPYLLPGSQRQQANAINSGPFFGCDTGTLMFKGSRTQRQYGPDGLIAQETMMRFAYRPIAAWDKILCPDDPTKGWVQVLYNGSSVLQSYDFSNLIPTAYRGD